MDEMPLSSALYSFKRGRKDRPRRARGEHHLLQRGVFELMTEADFREAMRFLKQSECWDKHFVDDVHETDSTPCGSLAL